MICSPRSVGLQNGEAKETSRRGNPPRERSDCGDSDLAWADELVAQLLVSRDAIDEAMRRGLLRFKPHREVKCWRFGDARNGSCRRLDGKSFRIRAQDVKAESETTGPFWHRLIGMDDVMKNDRCDVLLVPEGSKDALAAFHFASAEDTLCRIGVVAALGAGVRLLPDDVERFCGRRIRIFPDTDPAGQKAALRIAEALAPVTSEVQIFDLAGLKRDDGLPVKDLFDVSRIDCDDFEANRDLWSLTDLDSKGGRVILITSRTTSFFPPPLPPHEYPESHVFPVYPVSNSQDVTARLEALALRNACLKPHTAWQNSWHLARDLKADELRTLRKLTPKEMMAAFNKWYEASARNLDSQKTREQYLARFLSGIGKVRVPTGEGETLRKALAIFRNTPPPEIPAYPDAPESWRNLAALHRQLSHQSSTGTYFLGCRDAAKAHSQLNKDSANTINNALDRLGVIRLVKIGEQRPGGKASEYQYLLS